MAQIKVRDYAQAVSDADFYWYQCRFWKYCLAVSVIFNIVLGICLYVNSGKGQ